MIHTIASNRKKMTSIGLLAVGLIVAAYVVWMHIPRYIFVSGTFTNTQLERLSGEEGRVADATATSSYQMVEFTIDGQTALVDEVLTERSVRFASPVRVSLGFNEVSLPFNLVWYDPVEDKAWAIYESLTFSPRSIRRSLVANELLVDVVLNEQNYIEITPKISPPQTLAQRMYNIGNIGVTTGARHFDPRIVNQPVNVVALSREETEAIKERLESVRTE